MDQSLFNKVAEELEFAKYLESAETRAQLANRIEVAEAPSPTRWSPGRWLALAGLTAAAVRERLSRFLAAQAKERNKARKQAPKTDPA